MNLTNKVVLVTGGAQGIGKEIALHLAQLGAIVVVNYHKSNQNALSLMEEFQEKGYQGEAIQSDISIFQESENLIQQVVSKYGRIDILVNNAGITKDNLILRMSEQEFDDVIDVNLKGTWNCSKHALKYMVKQRAGKIINISSVVGITGNAGQSNYSASKAGIIGLTKSLALEMAKRNIQVNAVAPGFIETNMTISLPSDVVNYYKERIPLNRFGTPSDIAYVVAFLASSFADYITGQVIHVDGGLVM